MLGLGRDFANARGGESKSFLLLLVHKKKCFRSLG
jgi:hypothetical protein